MKWPKLHSFKTYSELETAPETRLYSRSYEVPYQNALAVASFGIALELHEVWQHMPGSVPHLDAFKPNTFSPAILPTMFVMNVEDSGRDFRWRLLGTTHCTCFGKGITSELLSETATRDTNARSSLSFAQACYTEQTPIFFCIEHRDETHVRNTTYTVFMPLADDDRAITRLFGCSITN
ncbi:MAG: hypothetical protein COB37_10725 [Kordiimonadales bacterium]|nr:MAG: hypothetical protein COB37_10725 [Kordiimonadales bacterium]